MNAGVKKSDYICEHCHSFSAQYILGGFSTTTCISNVIEGMYSIVAYLNTGVNYLSTRVYDQYACKLYQYTMRLDR